MSVLKYRNPSYTEGSSQPKWLPLQIPVPIIDLSTLATRTEIQDVERVAYNAVNTATLSDSKAESAKNAVATLQGLGNTTTAQQTLAGQVLQIETNKQDLLLIPSFALIKETNYNL